MKTFVRFLGVLFIYGGFAAAFIAVCVLGGNHVNAVVTVSAVISSLALVALGVLLANGPGARRKTRTELVKQVEYQRKIIRHLGMLLVHDNEEHAKTLAKLEETFHRYKAAAHWIRDDRDTAQAEAEQLRVQLAGCGVAANGGTEQVAKRGDYGWSASYEDVLGIRRKYDQLRYRVVGG